MRGWPLALMAGCLAGPGFAAPSDVSSFDAANIFASAERFITNYTLAAPDAAVIKAAITAQLREKATPEQARCLDRVEARAKPAAIYDQTLECIDFGALPPSQRDSLLRAAIAKALAAAADPDGALINVSDFDQYPNTDKTGAVGLLFRPSEAGVRIERVLDLAALVSGTVTPGASLVAIDGVPVAGLTGAEVADRLRGPIGSTARLTVSDTPGGAPQDAVFTRVDWMKIGPSLAVQQKGTTLVLRPRDGFTGEAALFMETPAQITEQLAAHADATHIILDLRGNSGGVLDVAVEVADLFLANQRIGSMIERRGDRAATGMIWQAKPGDPGERASLTIVTDATTAAGAEMIAAALGDNGRARIIGTETFGRGSVQTLLPLGKRNYFLKLTTGRLLRPGGAPLADKITPTCPATDLPEDLASLIDAVAALDCPQAVNSG